MAKQLDLQEQEQLDDLKAFWAQYGNAITWLLTLVLLGFAGWNGWGWWQRDQAAKAAALFEALDSTAQSGDAQRAALVFNDLRERYPGTAVAQQGGMLTAKVQQENGQNEQARATLRWVADNAMEDEYRTLARLRLAGLMFDAKQYDEAVKQLDAAVAPTFAALVADRRGDILLAQGKRDEAKAAYRTAFAGLEERGDLRRLVEAKLTALAAAPAAASGAAR